MPPSPHEPIAEQLARAAHRSRPGESPQVKQVLPCNFRRAAQMTREQLRAISLLQERFAGTLASSLAAYLRVGLEVQFHSAEQMLYGEYVQRLQQPSYLANFLIQPLDVDGLLDMDLALVFPMIDLVLGGPGQPEPEIRPTTEIEAEIMSGVLRILCRELEECWRPVLELEIHPGHHQTNTPASGLMLSTEKVLVLGFELHLAETHGRFHLIFPAVVSNALLRKLAVQWSYLRSNLASANRDRMRERLLGCRFCAELRVPASPIRMAELLALVPGQVLAMRHRVADPIHLTVAGEPLFLATPVSCGRQRGARVVDLIAS